MREVEVKILNNKVSVFLINENIYLKKDGEEIFEYFSGFWEWLIEKVGDEFEVIIQSDENIKVPDFIKIKKEEKKSFSTKNELIEYFISKKSLLRKNSD